MGFTAQSAEAELESYRYDCSASPDGRWNPLEFWEVKERSEQFKYQRLCRLAKQVLCATVTTAGVERIFSTAGFIVSSRRTLLGDSLFESLLFNKLNGDLRTFNTRLNDGVARKRKLSESETN